MGIEIKEMNQETEVLKTAQVNASGQRKLMEQEEVRTSSPDYDAVSTEGDSLSVSKEGKALNASGISQSGIVKNAGTDGTVIQKAAEEDVQEEEIVSTVNLSIYTETELEQMYLDGDITKVEYEDELRSRGSLE